jgi:hypothetical protein
MASQYYSLKYDSQTRKYQSRRLAEQMEEDLTQGSPESADVKRDTKVTIVQYENMQDSLWDGEALYAQWDRDTGEFVIRGDTDTRKCAEAVAGLAEKRKLLVEIEDNGPGQFVWRGYIGSAEFLSFDSDEVECALVMMLDDWLGIVPQFSKN